MTRKPIKTNELHHWWPRTLSNHWCADDGNVSVIRPSGECHSAPPGTYGAITNAHHIKLGGPWDSTFEPVFDQADREISEFVGWLLNLETPQVASQNAMVERITPQLLPDERRAQLARITASLLARSPCIRNSIKRTTEYRRGKFGLADPAANKSLIAANQQHLFEAYRKRMETSGRWAILFSDSKEFITGDGFFHNFPASQDGINSGLKLVLPILPTATIIYMLPMGYPTEPRLTTLRATANEVEFLNDFVQVYAQDFLFYRDERPALLDAFKIGAHQQFRYHGHDWLDALLDDLSQYSRWGENGTAEIGSRRPYTDSLQGKRWLDSFAADEEYK
jgi:Protein of unknown function (DUF4238)